MDRLYTKLKRKAIRDLLRGKRERDAHVVNNAREFYRCLQQLRSNEKRDRREELKNNS